MDYLEYKGYRGSVEYSKADNCLVGKVLGMSGNLIAYEGKTIDELRADFEAGIDSYLEACKADGIEPRKPYSGNVWEWCNDLLGNYSYAQQKNPVGAYSGTFYVFRGGSWVNEPWYARVSMRNGNQPRVRSVNLGLRLASDFK
ncbi:MAG: SUMF1/EgtB/PvdO family nonheme iron enzyme [Bacteroidaceae bacterium]|nr:SUMF1/EgtB/PvdO family nonheme iron enzyme [Bacteroidaceae bacterium]